MRSLSAEELRQRLDGQEPPALLDVRDPWEFELCHIEGSRNIPMEDIPAKIDTLDSNEEYIVICHHGMRSLQVAYFLENTGFEKVFNLDGGIEQWAARVDPDMERY